jgi:uncharacterized protein YndB with AHSA1/START domain
MTPDAELTRDMIGHVAEPGQRTELRLRLEKSIAVAAERVFASFAAEQVRSWWGPAGFTVPHLQFEPVEGSDYRIAMQPPEGDVFHIRGSFRTVEPPGRLAFTFIYEEPDPDDQETLVTLTLEPIGRATRLSLDQGPFKTAARLELHREGWTETLERLERSLA